MENQTQNRSLILIGYGMGGIILKQVRETVLPQKFPLKLNIQHESRRFSWLKPERTGFLTLHSSQLLGLYLSGHPI